MTLASGWPWGWAFASPASIRFGLALFPVPADRTGQAALPSFVGRMDLSAHPIRPGLALASCHLIPTAITAGAFRVASGLLCLHAVAITPAGSVEPAFRFQVWLQ